MKTVLLLVVLSSVAFADENAAALKACKAGKGEKCVEVGERILRGSSAPKEMQRGYDLFVDGCAKKAWKGCAYAASMKLKGTSVPKDEAVGLSFQLKACDLGDPASCNNAGTSFFDGVGGAKQDRAKARDLYEKTCKLGAGVGCFNLGNTYRLGEGAPVDPKLAFAAFQKSCDLDTYSGCTELGSMYFTGSPGVVEKDRVKAKTLYEKACRLGSQVSCDFLKKQ